MKLHKSFWLITVATLLAASLTASMGFWQLRRAAQKEAIAADILKQNSLERLDNIALSASKNIASLVYRQALLQGEWLPHATVFLDNRQMDGVPGFFVLTPLKLLPQGTVIVVQRGWVQRDFMQRTKLPTIVTPTGLVRIEGRLSAAPSKIYAPASLSGAAPAPEGAIRQNLDLTDLARSTGLSVLDASLQQTAGENLGAPDGLQRHWSAPNLGVEKHYGYAVQWFALSALLIGLYLWFQWIAPYVRTRST